MEEGEEGYEDLSDPEPEFDFLCDITRQIKLNGEIIGRIEACVVKREEMEDGESNAVTEGEPGGEDGGFERVGASR